MSKEGISCLSDAPEYFNMCYVAGLLPRNFDLSKPQDRSVSTYYIQWNPINLGLSGFFK